MVQSAFLLYAVAAVFLVFSKSYALDQWTEILGEWYLTLIQNMKMKQTLMEISPEIDVRKETQLSDICANSLHLIALDA